MSEEHDYVFKVLLIGDSGVGKSAILLRFTEDNFKSESASTIGVDFKIKYIDVQGKRLKLTLWDTAGQERFRTLTSSFYRNSHACCLLYDVCNSESFENLKMWMKELEMYSTYPDMVKLLIGNKIDKKGMRQIARKQGDQFAKENGMMFIECSAKTSEGIDSAFEEVAKKIMVTKSLVATGGVSTSGGSEKVRQIHGGWRRSENGSIDDGSNNVDKEGAKSRNPCFCF